MIETKNERRAMLLKADIEKLFEQFEDWDSSEFLNLGPESLRISLTKTQQDELYLIFDGRCNITGMKLYKENELTEKFGKNLFFKRFLMLRYDHRRPLSKRGTNDPANFQLLSALVNKEKNKICNICDKDLCEECALAWPEEFDVIIANGQDITNLRRE